MKQRIKIVFQEEFNLEKLIGISSIKQKINNRPKQIVSDDEILDEYDQSDGDEEVHFWELDFVINSSNSKYIAFDISKENDYSERSYFHVILDTQTKKIKYQRKFYDNSYIQFTHDSKYLIIQDDSKNALVDLETFKENLIDNKGDSIISIDSENNIYKLHSKIEDSCNLVVYSISDNSQKNVNIKQEIIIEDIVGFEKIFLSYAFVETQKTIYLLFLQNNKILQRCLQNHSYLDSKNLVLKNSIIVKQNKKQNDIYVKRLNNSKLIRKFKNADDAIIFKTTQSIYQYNFCQEKLKGVDKIERTNLVTGISIKPDLDLGKYDRQFHQQVFITQNYFLDLSRAKLRYFRISD
ncbi:unnamed protein product (macronuclear) [Paramecium tetraurelia]|uniref:Uncharacterized protein n=1 Tax=Paramecium tetraurelia TaxID=5888 RepID=A0DNT6_PARTE|nr:uncharacterized protein GSPATT00018899001 [Paramecium tetraurelia]CAK84703.1 unnamed protein product [Paramecium tetraurelia]|eukprot:XP_001452100.1 hypothetical protein (macronuclear) [Paramecium tetraurelia strain d4-2]